MIYKRKKREKKISFKKIKEKVRQLQKCLKIDEIEKQTSPIWAKIELIENQSIEKIIRYECSVRLLYSKKSDENEILESLLALTLFSNNTNVTDAEIKVEKNFDDYVKMNTALEIIANYRIIYDLQKKKIK